MNEKIVHRAKHVSPNGKVSPLCAVKPRAINLKVATWTLRDDAVTCPKCRSAMKIADGVAGAR